jgi:CRP/FNR family transcriptional regulator, cyclic AMP receptor protein
MPPPDLRRRNNAVAGFGNNRRSVQSAPQAASGKRSDAAAGSRAANDDVNPIDAPMESAETDLRDVRRRAQVIGSTPLLRSWPAPALLRLARASFVTTRPPGALVVEGGPTSGMLTVVVDGTALACVTGPDGKRVTFRIAAGVSVHGVIPLVDGKEMSNDVIALDTVTAIRIPHAALRAELQAAPMLWESVAIELAVRARRYTEQMKRFVFDQPRVHLASLLTAMAHSEGSVTHGQTMLIGQRLSQELVAEMLGISRQWTSTLIRDLVNEGLVRWRYGRVTVLDLQALRAIAEQGVNARI